MYVYMYICINDPKIDNRHSKSLTNGMQKIEGFGILYKVDRNTNGKT